MADGLTNGTELIDTSAAIRERAMTIGVDAHGLAPRNLSELMDFGQLMAKAGPMIGKAFRGQPGACVAISMQAMRWHMDPFAVSQKAYVTGENVAYEAQLINAVVLSNAPMVRRPQYTFTGSGANRRCKVSILLRGEPETLDYETPEIVPGGNSPLWKKDLDQQLSYYAIRSWARRHMPELLMGVYTPDELQDAGVIETRVIDNSDDYDQRPADERVGKYGVIGGQAGKDAFDDLAQRMTDSEDGAALEIVWDEAEKSNLSQNRIFALSEHYEACKEAHDNGRGPPDAPRFTDAPEPSPFEARKAEGEKVADAAGLDAWAKTLTPDVLGRCTEEERATLRTLYTSIKAKMTAAAPSAAGAAPADEGGGAAPSPSTTFEKLKAQGEAIRKVKGPRRVAHALQEWRDACEAAKFELSDIEAADLKALDADVAGKSAA